MARRVRVVAAAVGVHLAVKAAHGVPHTVAPVPNTALQLAVVVLVIFAAPLLAVWLLHRHPGRHRTAGWLLAGAGLAAFAFDTYYHFLSATPDNVARVTGAWSLPFLLTSAGTSIAALGLVAAGAWLWLGATGTPADPDQSATAR